MLGGLICYLFARIFLVLSGIYCYEEVNYSRETQLFTLKKLKEEATTTETTTDIEGGAAYSPAATSNKSTKNPRVVNIYAAMNIYSKVVGTVSDGDKLYGKNVYTGWIIIEEGRWVKIHDMRGNKLFDVEDVVDAPELNIPLEEKDEPDSNGGNTAMELADHYPSDQAVQNVKNNPSEGKNPRATIQNNNPSYAHLSSNRD